jgi:hypothetical protein
MSWQCVATVLATLLAFSIHCREDMRELFMLAQRAAMNPARTTRPTCFMTRPVNVTARSALIMCKLFRVVITWPTVDYCD